MTLKTFMSDPVRADMYRAWAAREDTKAIVKQLSDVFKPIGLPPAMKTGDAALYYAGFTDSYFLWIAGLTQLEEYVAAQQEIRAFSDFMKAPDYGAAQEIQDLMGKKATVGKGG